MSCQRKVTLKVAKGMLLYVMALGIVAFAAFALVGCGGGGNSTPTALAPASAWTQAGATYIGRAKCANCHSTIDDQYQLSGKGDGVSERHNNAGCQNCHVTGPETMPFNADGTIAAGAIPAHLTGIGCESCHGPGSKHLASKGGKLDITRTPPAKQTCMACHSNRPFNSITGPETLVNADFPGLKDLASTATIRGPHYAAGAFLLGRNGYNITKAMPGAHATLPNTCVDCHSSKVSPATNMVDHGVDAWSKPNLDTSRAICSGCHGGRSEAFLQAGVTEAMIKLGGVSATDPTTFDTNGKAADGMLQTYYANKGIAAIWAKAEADRTADEKIALANYKGAMWNFKIIYGDHSLGVHNPGFAKKLIADAEALLQ
jgi:formate-dependent nitrite reductase cytochrome c552 subunit